MKKALFALLASLGCTTAVLAEPMPISAAHYRHQAGDISVTALFDGVVYLPSKDVKNIGTGRLTQLLQQSNTPEHKEGLQTSVNAFLLEHNGEKVLVDTGTANCFAAFNPTLGHVPAALRAAGVRTEDIRHVLLTHGHSDHVCGLLTNDGRPNYPNATVWLAADEAAYWQNDQEKAKTPEAFRFLFDQERAALKPYAAAGKLRTFKAGDTLPLNARVVPTPGHTVGHTAFLLGEHSNAPLLLWGDVVHFPAVQFAVPGAAYAHDQNTNQGSRTRQHILQQAAAKHWLVAGAHLPFPGIGRVLKGSGKTEAYRWLPLEYAPQPPAH